MICIAKKANFLPFFKSAPSVVNRHLVRRKPDHRELAGQLNIELEAAALQFKARKTRAMKYVESRENVRRPLPEEQIVCRGKHDVRDIHEPRFDGRTAVFTVLPSSPTERAGYQHKLGTSGQYRSEYRFVVIK